MSRFLHLPLALVALLSLAAAAPPPVPGPTSPAQEDGRVIVLGFDGADARTVRDLVAAQPERYPTFRRLQETGTFVPLTVEAPPESPVSWAVLNTGQNPAKTGVPGFVRRSFIGGRPVPNVGHLVTDEARPLSDFADTAPIPLWSPNRMAATIGGAGFALVLIGLLVVLRGKKLVLVLPLALVVGAAGAYAGRSIPGYLPSEFPRMGNPNKATNFWDHAAEAGRRCVVLDPAQAFDMPAPEGAQVLAGLGLPDARGSIGEWFIYTTDPDQVDRPPKGNGTTTAGTIFRLDDYGAALETKIYGPKNFWLEQKLGKEKAELDERIKDPKIPLDESVAISERLRLIDDDLRKVQREGTSVPMTIVREGGKATITIDGQSQTLAEGQWSEFYELTFEMNWLLKVKALTRVKLLSLEEPFFKLYVNVLDLDPRDPPFWQPISTPPEFASELAHDCGLYETYGWPTATMPLKDEEETGVDSKLLMEDVEFTMKWREKLTYAQLERDDWECFMSIFSTTDRVQHMMYRYYDEQHPLYDAEAAKTELEFFGRTITYADAIPAIYEQMDRIVGKVLDSLRDDDTLLVCSDHGFQSFRRQVNVNNWLAENGWLSVRAGVRASESAMLDFIDWEDTTAYSLGMGFVYLNQEGREAKGQVAPEEREAKLRELRDALLAATDPATGEAFVKDAYITSEIHDGDYLDLEADLILGFAAPYRVSWSTTSGGIHLVKDDIGLMEPGPVFTDNDSPWSGGHVSMALSEVQGVFFSNRRVTIPEGGVKSLNLAPTILELLEVPIPAEMDLGPLSFAD